MFFSWMGGSEMKNYKDYVSKMSFLVKPSDPVPKDMQLKLDSKLHPLPTLTDVKNVKLPFKDKATKTLLGDICKIPKMCTFAIGALINLIVSEMPKDLVFINVGVWYGFSFFCGIVNNPNKKCVGVDNFTEFCNDAVKKAFYEKFAILGGMIKQNIYFLILTTWNILKSAMRARLDSMHMMQIIAKRPCAGH